MSSKDKIVMVIGQNGFIGSNLIEQLKDYYVIRPVSIRSSQDFDELNFNNVQAIVYTAGLAHNRAAESIEAYEEINWRLPVKFAMYAKQKDVAKFIYLSSIKVYGEFKDHARLTEATEVNPSDLYGKCKLKAEHDLLSLADISFSTTVLRLPLVYGPGVKGNLKALLSYVVKNKIIPLQGLKGRRSMLSLANLCIYIKKSIELNSSEVLLLADRNTLTTAQLSARISKQLKQRKWLLNLGSLLNGLLRRFKPALYARLCCDLIIDNGRTLRLLNLELHDNSEKVIDDMTKYYLNKQHD